MSYRHNFLVCTSIHMPTSVYTTMVTLKPITFLCIIVSRYVIVLQNKRKCYIVSLEIIYDQSNPI